MTEGRRTAALLPVLTFTTMVAAIISSLGAPLLPSISQHLHVPLSTAQWSLTATLLVGAVSSPFMGRLGDGPWRRETMIGGLVIVTAGGIIAALATSLGLLVLGRAFQGVGLGLVPLTMAAARDSLPTEKIQPAIALLSVCVAAGVGIGYPVSGLIADGPGIQAAFWFGALVSGLALLCVFLVVPSSRNNARSHLDLIGAFLMAAGLVCLLLAIAEGNNWGWTSAVEIGLFAGAAILLVTWVRQQLRAASPLVDLRLLRHPAVLTSDACAAVLGIAMYMYMSAITSYVQAPAGIGYGFAADVVVAGLCLVPLSITSLIASRLLPWFTSLVGVRALLPFGSLVVALAGVFFALVHASIWDAFIMTAILGVGIGSTSAAIPTLIVRAVPDEETGSAMGFYQVVRYVGFSVGSALAASVLAGHTPAGQHLPAESGYILILWIAVAICVAAAALAWFLPARGALTTGHDLDEETLEEDAELGPAGFIA